MVDTRDVDVGLRRIAGSLEEERENHRRLRHKLYSRDHMGILRFFHPDFALNKGFGLGNCQTMIFSNVW